MQHNKLLAILLAALAATTTAIPIIFENIEPHLPSQNVLYDRTKPPGAAPTYADRPSREYIRSLQKQLLDAPSSKARQDILIPFPPDATNMVYQFVNNSVEYPTGGTIAVAGVDQLPALTGIDLAMGVGFLNPCGLNVPHSHPRANEILIVHQGTLVAGFVLEENPNGAGNVGGKIKGGPMGTIPMVNATLSNYKGMMFPKALTHWQFNPTCEPAVFTASFDSSDPGRMQIAQTFFSVFPDDVVLTATGNNLEILGPENLDKLRKKIPNSFVLLVESCMKKCGFDR